VIAMQKLVILSFIAAVLSFSADAKDKIFHHTCKLFLPINNNFKAYSHNVKNVLHKKGYVTQEINQDIIGQIASENDLEISFNILKMSAVLGSSIQVTMSLDELAKDKTQEIQRNELRSIQCSQRAFVSFNLQNELAACIKKKMPLCEIWSLKN
jgi:hypothetical protein